MRSGLSTRQLADAVGVSESSIKRWIDDGLVTASRTAGGHRRVALADAVRFVRDAHLPVVRPEVLGMPDVASAPERPADVGEALYRALLAGADAEARGLVERAWLRGESVAALVDGPLRSALAWLGDLWRHDAYGIFLEHRATDLCLQALAHIRALVAPADDAPVALGGGPTGDPYLLPTMAAAVVLACEGWRAINLGPDTPWGTFERAATRLEPRLVWVSATGEGPSEPLVDGLAALARTLGPRGIEVVAGGRGLTGATLPRVPHLHSGNTMAELAAFARGLRVVEGSAQASR